jgi:hypothetical protein
MIIDEVPENVSIETTFVHVRRPNHLVKEFRVYDTRNNATFYGRNLNFLFFQVRYHRISLQLLVKKHTVRQ